MNVNIPNTIIYDNKNGNDYEKLIYEIFGGSGREKECSGDAECSLHEKKNMILNFLYSDDNNENKNSNPRNLIEVYETKSNNDTNINGYKNNTQKNDYVFSFDGQAIFTDLIFTDFDQIGKKEISAFNFENFCDSFFTLFSTTNITDSDFDTELNFDYSHKKIDSNENKDGNEIKENTESGELSNAETQIKIIARNRSQEFEKVKRSLSEICEMKRLENADNIFYDKNSINNQENSLRNILTILSDIQYLTTEEINEVKIEIINIKNNNNFNNKKIMDFGSEILEKLRNVNDTEILHFDTFSSQNYILNNSIHEINETIFNLNNSTLHKIEMQNEENDILFTDLNEKNGNILANLTVLFSENNYLKESITLMKNEFNKIMEENNNNQTNLNSEIKSNFSSNLSLLEEKFEQNIGAFKIENKAEMNFLNNSITVLFDEKIKNTAEKNDLSNLLLSQLIDTVRANCTDNIENVTDFFVQSFDHFNLTLNSKIDNISNITNMKFDKIDQDNITLNELIIKNKNNFSTLNNSYNELIIFTNKTESNLNLAIIDIENIKLENNLNSIIRTNLSIVIENVKKNNLNNFNEINTRFINVNENLINLKNDINMNISLINDKNIQENENIYDKIINLNEKIEIFHNKSIQIGEENEELILFMKYQNSANLTEIVDNFSSRLFELNQNKSVELLIFKEFVSENNFNFNLNISKIENNINSLNDSIRVYISNESNSIIDKINYIDNNNNESMSELNHKIENSNSTMNAKIIDIQKILLDEIFMLSNYTEIELEIVKTDIGILNDNFTNFSEIVLKNFTDLDNKFEKNFIDFKNENLDNLVNISNYFSVNLNEIEKKMESEIVRISGENKKNKNLMTVENKENIEKINLDIEFLTNYFNQSLIDFNILNEQNNIEFNFNLTQLNSTIFENFNFIIFGQKNIQDKNNNNFLLLQETIDENERKLNEKNMITNSKIDEEISKNYQNISSEKIIIMNNFDEKLNILDQKLYFELNTTKEKNSVQHENLKNKIENTELAIKNTEILITNSISDLNQNYSNIFAKINIDREDFNQKQNEKIKISLELFQEKLFSSNEIRKFENEKLSKEIDTVLITSLKNEDFIQEMIINKTRSDIYLDILNEKNMNLNNLFDLFLNSTFPIAIEKISKFEILFENSQEEKLQYLDLILPKIIETYTDIIDNKIINTNDKLLLITNKVENKLLIDDKINSKNIEDIITINLNLNENKNSILDFRNEISLSNTKNTELKKEIEQMRTINNDNISKIKTENEKLISNLKENMEKIITKNEILEKKYIITETLMEEQNKKIKNLETELDFFRKNSATIESVDSLRKLLYDLQSNMVLHSSKVLDVLLKNNQ